MVKGQLRMPQLTLFDTSEVLLADDDRGRIVYTPRLVDAATADAWFAELRRDVKWRTAPTFLSTVSG